MNSVTLSITTERRIPCVGITFWWLWRIMNFVLSTLRGKLVTTSQSEILDSSRLIKFDTWFTSWFTSWVNVLVNVVSSAYKMKLRRSLIVCISFIYITNNKGHNIEPRGTPVSKGFCRSYSVVFNVLGTAREVTFEPVYSGVPQAILLDFFNNMPWNCYDVLHYNYKKCTGYHGL